MGHEHPATAQAYYTIGTLYASLERLAEALEALASARKIIEKTLGPNDPHLGQIFEALSRVNEKAGNTLEAKEAAARAFKIRNPEKMRKPQNN